VSYDSVFIVIPAFNEAERIGGVIRGLRERGCKQVIVVDDGSEDKTGELARDAGAIVIRHFINRGQGAALQTGNVAARRLGAGVVVHFDGDGQFNPDDIRPALDRLVQSGVDVVLGSRFLDKRSVTMPWFKRMVIHPLGRLVNQLLTGLSLSDVHNGFRVLSRPALEQIEIRHDGMAHNSEIVAQIKARGLLFVEHPVEVRYFEFGQNVQGGLRIMKDWCVGLFVR
jgi:glycosyltransferase involved in cell wall biosynthesis